MQSAEAVPDCAPSIICVQSDLVSLLYKHMHALGRQNESIQYYCIIHQQYLIGKALGFKQIVTDGVSAVNLIRSRELNHRQFKALLNEIESEYGDAVYAALKFAKVKILQRSVSLLTSIRSKCSLPDASWVCDLAFLTDICPHLK